MKIALMPLTVIGTLVAACASLAAASTPVEASIVDSTIVKGFSCWNANASAERARVTAWMIKQHPDWTTTQAQDFRMFLYQVHHCPFPPYSRPKPRSYIQLRLRAREGDPKAETELGVAYETDLERTPDYLKVLECTTNKNIRGPSIGWFPSPTLYPKCWPHNYPKSIQWFTRAAERGYAPAEWHLGLMYEQGHGVPLSYAKAFQWFLASAQTGNVIARNSLVFLYETGHGPSSGYPLVLVWFREFAADPDSSMQIPAQAAIGVMYERGEAVPQSYEDAAKWFFVAMNSMSQVADDFQQGTMVMDGLNRVEKHLTDAQIESARKSADAWSAAHRPKPAPTSKPG